MKVIIPVASVGSKFKSKLHSDIPEALVEIAGKPVLKYVIDHCLKLNPTEVILVVGYKKKLIINYVTKNYPNTNISFAYQKKRNGDASAVKVGLENISDDESLLVVFANSLSDFDLSKKIHKGEEADLLVFSSKVTNPKCCGVLEICENGDILSIEEKPETPKSNFICSGIYYFKSSLLLKKTIDEIIEKKIAINGKFKISQVIENYIQMVDLSVKVANVEVWFDCRGDGRVLEANQYFLEKKSLSEEPRIHGTSIIIPPSYVASDSIVENSVIGPYASIGSGATVKDSIIKNSIASSNCKIENIVLESSIIGTRAVLFAEPSKTSIPDKSEVFLR